MNTFFVGNWKQNPKTVREAIVLAKTIQKGIQKNLQQKIILCVPSVYIAELARLKIKNMALGTQDVSTYREGSHTGEIAASHVASVGVSYVIVGHSERRRMGETSAMICEKIKNAFAAGLTPILCIGETERDAHHQYLRVVEAQLRESLTGIPSSKISKLLVAYEPVWAIGGATPASFEEINEMGIFIRKVLTDISTSKIAQAVPVLYGGSVDEKDAAGLFAHTDINGVLVGHVSLKPKAFLKIIASK